jgi:hypothetical protein
MHVFLEFLKKHMLFNSINRVEKNSIKKVCAKEYVIIFYRPTCLEKVIPTKFGGKKFYQFID